MCEDIFAKLKEMEEQEENNLLKIAEERLKTFNDNQLINQKEIDEKYEINDEDYSNFDDIEFE